MGYDPERIEQTRRNVLFDPFGVDIDFARCLVDYTHGYSNSGPFGAGPSKRDTLIQRQCAPALSPDERVIVGQCVADVSGLGVRTPRETKSKLAPTATEMGNV